MQTTEQLFLGKEKEFQARIEDSFPFLLQEFPMTLYLSELKEPDHYRHYETLSPALIDMLDRIKVKYGQEAVALYHKMSLSRMIVDTLNSLDDSHLPKTIRRLYLSWFERVFSDFSTQPDFCYDHNKPLWSLRKDIAVCCGRTIPIGGAWVVEPRLLARRAIIRQARRRGSINTDALPMSLSNILRKLRLYEAARHLSQAIRQMRGGYDWCYVIHTIERNIQEFNSEQMNLAYHNIAKLLENDSRIWGIFRSSWLLDPALHEISPNMDYLLKVPLNNGAELFYKGPCSAEGIWQATVMSPHRSRLYRDGLYEPKQYFYFWPRQRVIDAYCDI